MAGCGRYQKVIEAMCSPEEDFSVDFVLKGT